MFLFGVTRSSIARRIDAPRVDEFPAGEWIVTAATDGWLSSVASEAGTVTVREAAPFDGDMVFASASFSARDQSIEIHKSLIGGRQVYYHVAADGGFFCASHARLLRMAGVMLQDDPERMAELFVYRYVSPPRTLFRNIDQLLAGQRMRFERAGVTRRQTRSEMYSPPRPHTVGPQTSDGRYGKYGVRAHDALRGAMQAVAPAKDRVHVLASGGLDSSILFKMAQSDMGITDSHSTSYPFETEADDVEKHYALTAADAMGARHHFFVPTTRQFVRGVLEAVSLAEEPIVHTQSVLMMLLLRDGLPAGDGTVVVGQGADGAFGLRIHQTVEKVDRFRKSHPRLAPALHPSLWGAIQPLLSFPPVSRVMRRGLSLMRRDMGVLDVLHRRWGPDVPLSDPRHVLWALGVTGDERWAKRRYGATPAQVISSRAAAVESFADWHVLDALSLLDFLSDVTVTQSIWSKFGESARKVVYYPFNDPRLLDAAFQTPWRVKLAEPKGVLRDVARRVGLPEFIITRRKANFNINPGRWAVPGAALEPLVPLAASVFGEAEVRQMQSPTWRGAYTFWTMLNYAVWKRLFIDGEPVSALMAEVARSSAEPEMPEDPILAAGI